MSSTLHKAKNYLLILLLSPILLACSEPAESDGIPSPFTTFKIIFLLMIIAGIFAFLHLWLGRHPRERIAELIQERKNRQTAKANLAQPLAQFKVEYTMKFQIETLYNSRGDARHFLEYQAQHGAPWQRIQSYTEVSKAKEDLKDLEYRRDQSDGAFNQELQ